MVVDLDSWEACYADGRLANRAKCQAIATRCRTQAAIARVLPAAQKSRKRHVAHGRSGAGFAWGARDHGVIIAEELVLSFLIAILAVAASS
jgi:hypothetical protein